MTLTQLQYVVAVDQKRNFGLAAQACFVSQPTLSMQIQKLEDDLGVSLFDRSKKPVEPTDIGRKVVAQAKVVLQEALRIEELIKSERGEIRGDFFLGIIPTLAPYLLPLFLEKFIKKYPLVNLIIEELQTQQIINRLNDDQLDAGLLVTPLNVPGIIEKPLFRDPFLVYLSPKHPLLSKSKVTHQDLSLEDVWLLNEGHCFREQAIEICGRVKSKNSGKKNLTFESGNLETLKRLVDQKFGYTLLPSLAILGMSATEKKKKVRYFKAPIPTREVSLVYSRSFLKKSIIDALHNAISCSIPTELTKAKAHEQVIGVSSIKG
ncbi:MAG: LysR family transcriptional regulator [Candidatus Nitronauta litoralis]|uniref:LysR family transcriptional regulator n=1 Tax=Candidatus Nitronauta litoralis TaxID=2705533 RepID=A0A7T0BZG7_9BACT|nr:MAG: LysR family transcriptional regulator [Candidatus Nitronauta litoralis]